MANLSKNMSDETLDEYFKVRINSIYPKKPTTFDLFILINDRFVLYIRAGDQMEEEKIRSFEAKGADVFYVRETERQLYKDYIHELVKDEDMDTKQKALLLRESSYSLVEELFENPDVNQALKDSKSMISDFVEFMGKKPEAMAYLIGLSSHDFYTYNHSLDVSIYSLGLGRVAGQYDDNMLRELGQGALLHDLGKRHVDAEIICKKGPLDEAEWAQMRMHPTYGLKILNDLPDEDVTEELRACVFEHHENHIGNGYPQELEGHEIHPMARIVALTDTYDALTTKRSYNEPMSPAEALTLMKEKIAGRFDPDLLNAMHSVLFKMKI